MALGDWSSSKRTATFFGFNAPFIGGPQNIMSRQEDDQIIRNDILALLLTVPGERVMRPDFGVHLRDAIFDPDDYEAIQSLQDEIKSALERCDPRIASVEVSIDSSVANQFTVHVSAQLHDDPDHIVTVDTFLQTASNI